MTIFFSCLQKSTTPVKTFSRAYVKTVASHDRISLCVWAACASLALVALVLRGQGIGSLAVRRLFLIGGISGLVGAAALLVPCRVHASLFSSQWETGSWTEMALEGDKQRRTFLSNHIAPGWKYRSVAILTAMPVLPALVAGSILDMILGLCLGSGFLLTGDTTNSAFFFRGQVKAGMKGIQHLPSLLG